MICLFVDVTYYSSSVMVYFYLDQFYEIRPEDGFLVNFGSKIHFNMWERMGRL